MTEFRFYHLQGGRPLDDVLRNLLEQSLSRGWRVVVQAGSEERVEALDAYLWTYRDDSFLPHGTWREPNAEAQPILLTVLDHNPNAATVRFLIEGVDVPAEADSYERIVLLFDGDDDGQVASARERWTGAKAAGHEVSYWQPDERGRWVQKR
jgi:DNA polymerase-3 subunit chi